MMAGRRADRRANGQRANAGTCPLPARKRVAVRATANRRANPLFARTPSETRAIQGRAAGSGQPLRGGAGFARPPTGRGEATDDISKTGGQNR